MFYSIRFQTGEIKEFASEIKIGKIPCMDLIDMEEYRQVCIALRSFGVYEVEGQTYDVNARNRVKEPDFEFRAKFHVNADSQKGDKDNCEMFADFYFEQYIERDYDSIFGD
jgi:hypothetical protein